ncbi:Putative ammonia monooxygenase [Corynebacterium glaucum]|uniref:Putative ammonia monooxygenase n=1 Tax=Corynebacterium glaucum TaxID=187491 RepID=A0A1Q2HT97_9CORY|nr:AbrB family transcriptional regulator [Corynebacterium glaucum]AQQ14063.1 Putative ammonia monooxygenase [Corynebacterium glaucum]
MNRWLIAAPTSVILGALLSWLHVPAAWILGGIIGSGAVALASGRDLPLNKHLFNFARGAIGVLAALPLLGVPLGQILPFLIPALVAAAAALAMAFGGGMVLANHGVSRETGILSLLPGGASVMPAIADEVGADMRYVALSQYLRLLIVSITLPLVSAVLDAPAAGPIQAVQADWWMWLLVPALIVVGVPLGKLLHLPNASVFGPMLTTVAVGSVLNIPIVSPRPLSVVAFVVLGWMCGGALSVPALKQFSRLLPATLAYIAALMAACAGLGWVMSKWMGITFYEGYLATSPGALETVLVLSTEGGAGPAVIAMQLVRLICVLIFAAYLPGILKRMRRGR